jgi:hypothetical protein
MGKGLARTELSSIAPHEPIRVLRGRDSVRLQRGKVAKIYSLGKL